MNTCQRQKLSLSRYFITSRCNVILFCNSLSAYALLNASRIAWIHVCTRTAIEQLGVSSGLATRVILRLEELITRGCTCLWFNFCTVVSDCFGLRFKWYTMYAMYFFENVGGSLIKHINGQTIFHSWLRVWILYLKGSYIAQCTTFPTLTPILPSVCSRHVKMY
jgi:hypothetical protein